MVDRTIQTFKSHLKSGLATCDQNFPLCEWNRRVPQAILVINLLSSSRSHPNISAYIALFGGFNFKFTPFAPSGTKDNRNSWELNELDGYYIGPALQYYRYVTCYLTKTKSKRVSDTVKFIENVIPIPETSMTDHLR